MTNQGLKTRSCSYYIQCTRCKCTKLLSQIHLHKDRTVPHLVAIRVMCCSILLPEYISSKALRASHDREMFFNCVFQSIFEPIIGLPRRKISTWTDQNTRRCVMRKEKIKLENNSLGNANCNGRRTIFRLMIESYENRCVFAWSEFTSLILKQKQAVC